MEDDKLTKDEKIMLLSMIDATAFGGKDIEKIYNIKRKLIKGVEVITNNGN